jgi:NAD-dependent dihydropyrimidine dehydrogenase PreA subunit
MSELKNHPTVQSLSTANPNRFHQVDEAWLRQLALDAGADDVGLISIERPELDKERADILSVLPRTQTLLSFVCRMSRDPMRAPQRSIANVEFHHTGDEVNEVGRRIVHACEQQGVRAVNITMGFPMEADRWPNKMWVVSHKPIAVAAGLGQMGIHRNVIHPRFGNFILLGTVLLDIKIAEESKPIDFNPCLSCKLCVAACPTGAIAPDGHFDFLACYTHNYREFMGGFTDWVETIASSKKASDYRNKVTDSETVSMWQSLSFGPNYKAAYCLAVCPAGEEVITPFLENRKEFLSDVLRPLQEKEETIYVMPDTDAESYVLRRFPHKKTRRVKNARRPDSIQGFLRTMQLSFQRGKSEGVDAVYHFTFTGKEKRAATIVIREKKLQVQEGHIGTPDFRLTADSETWLRFLAKETSLFWAILRRKIKFKGSPKFFLAFGKCFP